MKSLRFIMFGSFVLAILLGIWAQDLAYFFRNHFVNILPVYYLTGLTIVSILLFLFAFILSFSLYKDQKGNHKKASIYQLVIIIGAVLTSAWSLLVLIMWWG